MTTRLRTSPFDPATYLRSEEAIAVFLADAYDSGDDRLFQEALQVAARARGMTEVARTSGLGRESLYKALAPDAQPRFATVRKVMAALGVSLQFAAAGPKPARKKAANRPVAKRAARPRVAAKRPLPKAAPGKAAAPKPTRR